MEGKQDPMAGSAGATGALTSLVCPPPSRCPYCHPAAGRHWTRWGSYERYAGDPEDPSRRMAVPRYWCHVTGRTFSLLSDGLLPYCALRADRVLAALTALVVAGQPLAPLARKAAVGRGLLRSIRSRFLRTAPRLRLPPRAGPLAAAAFLEALPAAADLFRRWKEGEPKCCIVGIYAR